MEHNIIDVINAVTDPKTALMGQMQLKNKEDNQSIIPVSDLMLCFIPIGPANHSEGHTSGSAL